MRNKAVGNTALWLLYQLLALDSFPVWVPAWDSSNGLWLRICKPSKLFLHQGCCLNTAIVALRHPVICRFQIWIFSFECITWSNHRSQEGREGPLVERGERALEGRTAGHGCYEEGKGENWGRFLISFLLPWARQLTYLGLTVSVGWMDFMTSIVLNKPSWS